MPPSPSTDLLRRARQRADLTQAAAAERLGVSQSTYSRWEASPGEIPVERMLDLQDALGVPRGSLVLSVTEMADCLDHQVDELSLEQVDYLIPKVRDLLDRCVERRQQLVSGGRYTGPERRSRDRRALS